MKRVYANVLLLVLIRILWIPKKVMKTAAETCELSDKWRDKVFVRLAKT